ncbi:hypothetical protein GA0115257_110116 [Streptomyces sp. LcepLS]|nr:hypothetical protein GA0115251_11643 [Streptomyces sp. TverLS-915]SCF28571.1 hypothetical protein GA0115257_110116 [Streptomyces sp. LcepLS]
MPSRSLSGALRPHGRTETASCLILLLPDAPSDLGAGICPPPTFSGCGGK